MLEPIIEHVNGCSQSALGNHSGEVAVLTDGDDGSRHRAGQHQRLIACAIDALQRGAAIGHDDHAVGGLMSSIASAEDGGTLASCEKPSGDERDERRFPCAADAEVAHADHRRRQTAPQIGMPLEPAAAGSYSLGVQEIKQWV